MLIPLSTYFYVVVGVFCLYLFPGLFAVVGTCGSALLAFGRLDLTQSALSPGELQRNLAIAGSLGVLGSAGVAWLWVKGRRILRSQDRFLYFTPFWWNVLPPFAYLSGVVVSGPILYVMSA